MGESIVEEIQLKEENVGEINKFVFFVFNIFEVCTQTFVFIIFIFSFLFRTVGVDGRSMNNTLEDRDRLFIVSPILHKPKVKDIVIVNTLESLDAFIVKRVIATQGQIVDLRKENDDYYYVYVDGKKLAENYIKEPIKEYNVGDLKYPMEVPKGCVFIMGDNRNNSKDSREIGVVNVEKLKGTAFARILPISKFKIFKN